MGLLVGGQGKIMILVLNIGFAHQKPFSVSEVQLLFFYYHEMLVSTSPNFCSNLFGWSSKNKIL